jgi:glutamate-5-semialdehyde dehydrogenase
MNSIEYIEDICKKVKSASRVTANLSTNEKNSILKNIATKMRNNIGYLVDENKKDLMAARDSGVTDAFYDRLLLDNERLEGMARSIEEIASLDDPVGRIENTRVRPSGIRVGQMRVPIGVIAVVYESRPNVTTDIAALCLKSGNAAILRGGKESIFSNIALHTIIRDAISESGYPEYAVALIEKTDRELVPILLKMNQYIDIVIPRGGESLIKRVTEESTIPVIKHDKGVCHTYIDMSADEKMAIDISINAKVQRPGVCNAMETLLINKDFPHQKSLLHALIGEGVELRGCPETVKIIPDRIKPASKDDWSTEYLELILSVKIVDSINQAIEHIAQNSSGHSEAIVTSDYRNAERFLREIDSSAVFVNTSTRFHDGGEFGLGAEVGISTQKLHARGAMGIEGLTCLKYIVYGYGQVRT